jgi:hypothetical protein
VTAERQRREYAIASPEELSEERAARIFFVSWALLGRQRAASILSQKCPTTFFNFHVVLGVSTTVRLVRAKGGAVLDSLAGGVYVWLSDSGRARAAVVLSCVFVTSAPTPSAPQKSLPEVPGLSFFFDSAQGYFEERLLTGLFF